MTATKKDELTEILHELRKIGDIIGSSVISTDGLCIASDLGNIDEETFAAMAAAMNGAAETALMELQQGSLRQIIIEADRGKIVAITAGEKSFLIILANPELNLGLALLELGKASGKIAELLGSE